jgi:signal peptidase II
MQLSSRHWKTDLIMGLAVLLGDRVIKYLSLYWLVPGVPAKVGSIFGIDLFWTLTYNQGAAWGVFDGSPGVLLIFRILFIALLAYVYLKSALSPLSSTALALVLAGACGNIIDTFMWGHVVDMIHLQFWGWDYPVFNVADMAICIGSVVFCSQTVFFPSKK